MEALIIDETESTPKIELNPVKNEFLIQGISMHENPPSFYKEVIDWVEEYKKSPIRDANFEIQLEYFNSSSALVLSDLMKRICSIGNQNKIVWKYKTDDEDLKEAGEEYRMIIGDNVVLEEI